MFEPLKRWMTGRRPAKGSLEVARAWCDGRKLRLQALGDKSGLLIEGHRNAVDWRMEWGTSQRSYVSGPELRIRAEMNLPLDLHLLVLNRSLQESIEAAVFAQYVEDIQTRLDTQTPPEMRWLVLFPRMSRNDLQDLAPSFAAVSSHKPWLMAWLDGPLSQALQQAPRRADDPLVLTIGKGRLTLRLGLGTITTEALDAWVGLFETGIDQAGRVLLESGDDPTPSTQPGMWPTLDEDLDPPKADTGR